MPVPVTNEALAERIESAISSINRLARAVEIQNGRVAAIEIARAEEKGAREAALRVAEAAKSLAERSHTWKLGVAAAIIGGIGVASTFADIFAHYLFHH